MPSALLGPLVGARCQNGADGRARGDVRDSGSGRPRGGSAPSRGRLGARGVRERADRHGGHLAPGRHPPLQPRVRRPARLHARGARDGDLGRPHAPRRHRAFAGARDEARLGRGLLGAYREALRRQGRARRPRGRLDEPASRREGATALPRYARRRRDAPARRGGGAGAVGRGDPRPLRERPVRLPQPRLRRRLRPDQRHRARVARLPEGRDRRQEELRRPPDSGGPRDVPHELRPAQGAGLGPGPALRPRLPGREPPPGRPERDGGAGRSRRLRHEPLDDDRRHAPPGRRPRARRERGDSAAGSGARRPRELPPRRPDGNVDELVGPRPDLRNRTRLPARRGGVACARPSRRPPGDGGLFPRRGPRPGTAVRPRLPNRPALRRRGALGPRRRRPRARRGRRRRPDARRDPGRHRAAPRRGGDPGEPRAPRPLHPPLADLRLREGRHRDGEPGPLRERELRPDDRRPRLADGREDDGGALPARARREVHARRPGSRRPGRGPPARRGARGPELHHDQVPDPSRGAPAARRLHDRHSGPQGGRGAASGGREALPAPRRGDLGGRRPDRRRPDPGMQRPVRRDARL